MAEDSVRQKMVQGIADGIDHYYEKHPSKAAEAEQKQAGSGSSPQGNSSLLQGLKKSVETDVLPDHTALGEKWSVSWISLDGSQKNKADISGDQPLLAASEMKLFILAAAYEKKLNQADLARFQNLSEKMITISDNDAANEMVDWLGDGSPETGMKVVNQFCTDHGYTGTGMGRKFLDTTSGGENYTTSSDCAELLADIAAGDCVSREASEEIENLMRQQTRTSKIPAGAAGTGVTTANKTGELWGGGLGYAENDAAILRSRSHTWVLVVLSQDLQSDEDAISTIQKISRMTCEKMTGE